VGDSVVQELEPGPEPGVVYEVTAPVPASEAGVAAAPAARRLPPLWHNRDYMLLWGGQVVSTLGSSMSGIVFPLLILALTGSPEAAGIATALGSIPYLFLSLPAGALVDRWNRKRVMILCDAGRAVSLASVPIALAFGVLTVWQLYANALIEGTLFVFFNIAEVAALPRVVAKEQLPAATAQNESAFATAALIGPTVGGFLYQTVGRAVPFVIDAVSYTVSVVSLLTIKTAFQTERAPATRNLGAEIGEGVRWLWRQPLIRFMAFLTGGLNFVNAASGLIIIVLAKQMGAGEGAIGTIFSIAAIGGIAGAALGGPIAKRFSFGQVIIATMWVQALLFPLILIAPNIFVIGVISAGWFLVTPIYNVKQFSYRVALIPDALQGRVNSAFRLLAFGFQPLGATLAGILLERAGTSPAILVFTAWILGLSVLATLNSHVRRAAPVPETA
jgi:predicted MFS family arabinose efflux permease